MAGKTDWFGAGLPREGAAAGKATLADVADRDVPTCTLGETAAGVRPRLGSAELCLVVNPGRIVLGLIRAEDLQGDDDRPVSEVMREGPSTMRPHVLVDELSSRYQDQANRPRWVIVTTSEGSLVGAVHVSDVVAGRAPVEG